MTHTCGSYEYIKAHASFQVPTVHIQKCISKPPPNILVLLISPTLKSQPAMASLLVAAHPPYNPLFSLFTSPYSLSTILSLSFLSFAISMFAPTPSPLLVMSSLVFWFLSSFYSFLWTLPDASGYFLSLIHNKNLPPNERLFWKVLY